MIKLKSIEEPSSPRNDYLKSLKASSRSPAGLLRLPQRQPRAASKAVRAACHKCHPSCPRRHAVRARPRTRPSRRTPRGAHGRSGAARGRCPRVLICLLAAGSCSGSSATVLNGAPVLNNGKLKRGQEDHVRLHRKSRSRLRVLQRSNSKELEASTAIFDCDLDDFIGALDELPPPKPNLIRSKATCTKPFSELEEDLDYLLQLGKGEATVQREAPLFDNSSRP
jgi:hypothetical protein